MSQISTADNLFKPPQTIVIQPRKRLSVRDFTEMWQYRDLCWTLSIRDIQIRYKQTLLGAVWALLQPLATSGVATVVFGHFLGLASGSLADYFLQVFPAMIIWSLFSAIITATSNSLVSNAEMLRKVYFPRLIIPLSSAGAPLLDFLVASSVAIAFLTFTTQSISIHFLLIPLIVLSTLIAAFGIGLSLAALTVVYRDFRLVVPFMVQLLFFVTPVLYALPVTDKWLPYASLNPMFGPITTLRAILEGNPYSFTPWAISLSISATTLSFGIFVFTRIERKFADIV
ncbi:ABC transporter permease [Poriferisphaera corsica]|uniref:ABC transporter permease n=1 Tax=Poriferisphaera corsica TaxID=2528020 RepID=UPI00190B909F|nr:ABC transporter permease [Poriferisphaera corsica]